MNSNSEDATRAFRSGLSYPPELPISRHRRQLVDLIRDNQVVIVAGETGSGKSTQLPKLCLEAGRGSSGIIGHTQPRRLAARSIAERVAEETKSAVGDFVGYSVRFNDRTSSRTLIRVMTDGILLAELQRDQDLRRYDTIIVDEAHERSLNIDFILGYLHQLLPRRPDLRLIITSATIDVDRFSRHFGDAPVVEVSGRTFPVELRYRPFDEPDGTEPLSQPDAIAQAVTELAAEGPGDMLVFLAGERDIRETAEALHDVGLANTEIFPLYGRLSSAEQHRVFRPHRGRRIVLATNVAETSVTVPGIRYVIDPGRARVSRFNPRTKVQRLPIEKVSQASANQRAGRCGRVGPGVCVRLFSEDDFDSREEFTQPEILRTNLASVILQMASLGLGDISSFPFLEPPEDRGIADGIALLEELDALDPEHLQTDKWLTPLGRELARLPVDPRFARMIIEAADHGALAEVLIIVAGLSIQDPRERPTDRTTEAAEAHRRFQHPASDFITLLKLWRHVLDRRQKLTRNQFRRLCRREFLNYNRIREWEDTRSQLEETAAELGYRLSGNRATVDTIHRCLLAGLLSHIGLLQDSGKSAGRRSQRGRQSRQRGGNYLGARAAQFRLGRESALAGNPPPWVMAAELVETNEMWARMAAPIEPRWAEELGFYLVKQSYSDPIWDADAGLASTRERVTLYGLPLVENRLRPLSQVDANRARELFIHHALVNGDWSSTHSFIVHNRELVAEMEELEIRARRELLADEEAIHRFFEDRIPSAVTSATHFDQWWKVEQQTNPRLLHLSHNDVQHPEAPLTGIEDFPNHWTIGGIELELAYEHDGASPIDGLSVHVPVEVLNQLDDWPFLWSVPGLRIELVTALVRSLPKQARRELAPVADTVASVVPEIAAEASNRPLTTALADALSRRAGAVLRPDDFDWARVPDYLRPTIRIIGDQRQLLAEGKDLAELKLLLANQTQQAIAELSIIDGQEGPLRQLTGQKITTWDFDQLPKVVETDGPTHTIRAYPALADHDGTVSIELFANESEQYDAMWTGTRRLLRLQLPSPIRKLDRMLGQQTKMAMSTNRVQSKAEWYNDAANCVLDVIIADHGGPAWEKSEFDAITTAAHRELTPLLDAIVGLLDVLVSVTTRIDDRLAALEGAASLQVSAADARAHFGRLTYPGFLAGVGYGRLTDIVRYLQAIDHRLDRLTENPQSDLKRAVECLAVEERHREEVDRLGMTEELEQLQWQLEELRVAQFALQLRPTAAGTERVSARRIERALDRLA